MVSNNPTEHRWVDQVDFGEIGITGAATPLRMRCSMLPEDELETFRSPSRNFSCRANRHVKNQWTE
jgi:hypothetical protein